MRDFRVGKEAQEKLKSALSMISDAVGSTLGPGGMPFGYDRAHSDFRLVSTFSKDGLTVLRALSFPDDPAAHAVLEYCRQASSHSFVASGDGSTSTCVLANAVAQAISAANCKYPQMLARQFEAQAEDAIQAIKKEAIRTEDAIRKVALTSSNGDEELTDITLQAIKQSSAFGSILVEKRPNNKERYTISKQDGYSNCAGYNYNSTFAVSASEDAGSSKPIDWEDPYVVTFNGHLLQENQLDPILSAWNEKLKKRKGNLVIVAYDTGDAVTNKLMMLNRTMVNENIAAFIVKPKLSGEILSGFQILRDIASFAGIADDKIIDGGNYKQVDESFIGECKTVSISTTRTAFLGRADNHWVDKRISQNESIAEQAGSDYDRELTKIRNAELAEGLVLVRIGGGTMPDLQERADRFDDASKAAQSAMRYGALPGCGCSYIRAGLLAGVHEGLAFALRSIYSKVLSNFGVDPHDEFIPSRGNAVKIDSEGLGVIHGDAQDLDILDAVETVCAVIKNGVSLGVQIASLGGYAYRGKNEHEN